MIHRPNLYYSKISKRKLKKEYSISSGTGKNRTSQTVSSTHACPSHFEGQARYFTVLERHKVKLDKNKMDSKFIKSHQCSLLERSHAVFWLKLILPEFWSRPTLQKQILTGLLVTKIYKNRTMKISLFNYSMLGYISPITNPSPISIEEILVQPISLNPHTRLDFKHHPTQEYFRQFYQYLGPL